MTCHEPIELAVAIPTYKRPVELARLLTSIPNHIAVGISDNGAHLPTGFASDRPRVRIARTTNEIPIFSNWNRAVAITSSQYFVNPSDDDIFYPNAFDEFRSAISHHADADIFIFGHHVIDDNEYVLSSWAPDRTHQDDPPLGFNPFSKGVDARMPSIVMRRSLFDRLGGYDEQLLLTAGDSDLIQRMLLVGRAVWIPKIVAGYRVWAGNLTSQRQLSIQWMNEVEIWTQRVGTLARYRFKKAGIPFDPRAYADTILSYNLMSATAQARRKNDWLAIHSLLRRVRVPWHTSPPLLAKLLALRIYAACTA